VLFSAISYLVTVLEPTSLNRELVSAMAPSIVANRLSFTLGLRGPSLAVDTACSSAATAIHMARLSMGNGRQRAGPKLAQPITYSFFVLFFFTPSRGSLFENFGMPLESCKAFEWRNVIVFEHSFSM